MLVRYSAMSPWKRFKASCAAVLVAGLTMTASAFAELWPTLDDYVSRCVLIVKARATHDANENEMCTFEVLESWKGHFDAAGFATGMAQGNVVRARQGEHGVNVTRGQEIVLFYTRHNQPGEKLLFHSTAFPINDGTITYAATNYGGLREEMTVEGFKQRISAKPASTQPAERSTTRPAAPARE